MLSDGVCIIPFGPKLTTPQHPFDLRVLFEEFSAGIALDVLYDRTRCSCGDGLYEEMHMVTVGANFKKVNVESSLYFKTDCGERSSNTVGEHVPSVLDGTDDMVDEPRLVVAARDVPFLHATNIHLIWMTSQQAARKSL